MAISATAARSELYRVIDSALEAHEPIQITGNRGDAIVVSGVNWTSFHEALYLVSISGMRESILEGIAEPIEECSTEKDL